MGPRGPGFPCWHKDQANKLISTTACVSKDSGSEDQVSHVRMNDAILLVKAHKADRQR